MKVLILEKEYSTESIEVIQAKHRTYLMNYSDIDTEKGDNTIVPSYENLTE
jgi:hypothetical protein